MLEVPYFCFAKAQSKRVFALIFRDGHVSYELAVNEQRIVVVPIRVLPVLTTSVKVFFENTSRLAVDGELAEMKKMSRFSAIMTYFVVTTNSSSPSAFAAKSLSRATKSSTSDSYSIEGRLCYRWYIVSYRFHNV